MPQYFYTAKSKEKERRVSDVMKAKNRKELAKKLRQKNLFLIEAKKKRDKKSFSIPFFNKVSLADKIFLSKNLAMMLSGGVSLSRTLKTLSVQSKNEKLKSVLLDIREEVSKGKSLSESMEDHSDIFSKVFRSMIQIAEETGTIEETLKTLTEQLEKEHQIKSEVKGALIYPTVIVCTMVVIGIVMLTVVVPVLSDTFDALQADLPFTTRFVIAFGNLLAENWYLLPFLLLLIFIIGKMVFKTRKGKRSLDRLILKTPLISKLVKKRNSAYTARTLNSLLSSGVSIIKALEIIEENLSNTYFKEALSESSEKIKRGSNISESLKPYSNLFSVVLIQMIEVGEETGRTAEALSTTAEFLEEEVFNTTKNMASLLEPILMVVIGVSIGFFALSMLQPMYSILEAL